ncbi:hypothetical protein L7F22_063175 [Adiantum nelumboides]|nr:hypothetical protein [Adiantum nelumboides]
MVAFDVPHMQTHDVFEGLLPSFVENQESQQTDNLDQSLDQHVTPHDVEESVLCRDDNGVVWINDSKATNVDATYTGLRGLTKQGCVVLLGGLAKILDESGNIGFGNLVHVLKSHRAVVTFGAFGERIKKDLEANGLVIPCKQSKGLKEAVQVAKSIAQPGDAVVLSPACASYDEFHNFEHRGQFFSDLARSRS